MVATSCGKFLPLKVEMSKMFEENDDKIALIQLTCERVTIWRGLKKEKFFLHSHPLKVVEVQSLTENQWKNTAFSNEKKFFLHFQSFPTTCIKLVSISAPFKRSFPTR
jgi:hypothetical protein